MENDTNITKADVPWFRVRGSKINLVYILLIVIGVIFSAEGYLVRPNAIELSVGLIMGLTFGVWSSRIYLDGVIRVARRLRDNPQVIGFPGLLPPERNIKNIISSGVLFLVVVIGAVSTYALACCVTHIHLVTKNHILSEPKAYLHYPAIFAYIITASVINDLRILRWYYQLPSEKNNPPGKGYLEG